MSKYILCLILTSLFTLVACDNNDGAAERAGEKIDQTYEIAEDSMKDMSNQIEDKTEQFGDEIKDAVDDMKE